MSSLLVTFSLLPASSMRPIAHKFTIVDFFSIAFTSIFATALRMGCRRHNRNMCAVNSAWICFATLATGLAARALCHICPDISSIFSQRSVPIAIDDPSGEMLRSVPLSYLLYQILKFISSAVVQRIIEPIALMLKYWSTEC